MLALVAVACSATSSPTTTTSTAPSTTTTTSMPAPTTTSTVSSACTGTFASRGPVTRFTDADGDAVNVTGILSESLDGCDRTTVQLSTAAGAPATGTGDVSVEWLDDLGVLRIQLGSVFATAVSDQVFESLVLDRLYVVRSLEGSLFIDLITSQPATAQALIESDPARVVVELVPSGDGVDGQPVADGPVVVTHITAVDGFPLVIEGYSRTFEANVLARINGELVGLTTAADWLETWGEFRIDVAAAPDEPEELFVGSDSPQDGSPEGVTIPLPLP